VHWREGLSASQVATARKFGSNDILPPLSAGWRAVARDTARDPMLWFLGVTSGISFALGQIGEGWMLLAALVPLLGMDAYLHRRTLASAAGLASRLATTARVRRDGRWLDIPGHDLLPGDIVEVGTGAYFPADGVLVAGTHLQADESTITGESLPVRKQPTAADMAPGGSRVADIHWVTAGTRLLAGTAQFCVVFIGAETRYGEIARAAAAGAHAATPLQKAIAELVSTLLVAAILVCLVLAIVRLHQGYGWADALLSAVTLAVAALPEEFPVVYTFFLGLGVLRLARRKGLVRRAVAVENIGRTTAIVSDKTGTITEGTLCVAHCMPANAYDEKWLLRVALGATRAQGTDPLDVALRSAGPPPALGESPIAEYPFTEARRRETVVRRMDGELRACLKGAPETVFQRCDLPPAQAIEWLAKVDGLASSGHKVVACAHRSIDAAAPPSEPEGGFELAGLIAFEDPVRPGVRDAIQECLQAGMRVLMVTGDHPGTAAAIAREIGLGGGQPQVLSLGDKCDTDIPASTKGLHVVARATPTQKLQLVRALKTEGEIVAVTGDGVNDVPALNEADIGIAMGQRGTQSAREVAPLILLDDNFRTIVDAIAEGRRLFENLRVTFTYLLLIHIPLVVGAAAIPLLGMPLLFLPVHIVWLELIIHPTAMLAFQEHSPAGRLVPVARGRHARFFSVQAWSGIALLGAVASSLLIWSYVHALGVGQDVEHARALALTLLVLMSAAVTSALTQLRTVAARWMALATVASAVILVQWPVFSAPLHLRPLHLADWNLALAAAALLGLGAAVLVRQTANVRRSLPWHRPFP
jgi:Ca2+-transporting ATPase